MSKGHGNGANGEGTPKFYTTHQVSKLLGVSIPTVCNWTDSGELKAHRTPGGHRRIGHESLVHFVEQRGLDISLGPEDARARILIVDDERDFSEMLRDYLQIKGYDVEIAESGFQAGMTVARFRPDLILMDIMMPEMNGFEVHRVLRSEPQTRDIPVIACTAYRDADVDARVVKERFEGFIEKPIKMSQLLLLIQRTLGSSSGVAR
ncbi:MAG: response regulator [Deltaproteobacteria bacterium]|nr:MAG: response regulator [Deltaproteobacteria bacterium]